MRYRPEIDGLRALAVVPVILFHAGAPAVTGGFVGVDVFFVISGFLITSIIRTELAANCFSVTNFYERRIRRIFPLLFVVIAVTLAGGFLIQLPPADLVTLAHSAVSAAFFVANYFFLDTLGGGYFSPAAESQPLLHAWSLGVEEQYYLVFPLLLLMMRRRSATFVFTTLALLLLSSLLLNLLLTGRDPMTAFFSTPTRVWELLIGSLLAFVPASWRLERAWRAAGSSFGVTLLLFSVFSFSEERAFPGLSALVPTLGAALVILSNFGAVEERGGLLRNPVLVFTGKISYSLYLWHWPVLVAFFLLTSSVELSSYDRISAIGLTFALSVLSWKYIEQPFRRPRNGGSRKRVFAQALSLMLAALAVSALIHVQDGFPDRLPSELRPLADVEQLRSLDTKRCLHRGSPSWMGSSEEMAKHLCPVGASAGEVGFLLWGDSHAAALRPGLAAAAENLGIAGLYAGYGACPPILGLRRYEKSEEHKCRAFNDAVLDYVSVYKIPIIVLHGRWSLMYTGIRYDGEAGQNVPLSPGSISDNAAVFEELFTDTVSRLTALGARVLIVGPVPEISFDVPNRLLRRALRGLPIDKQYADERQGFEHRNRDLNSFLAGLQEPPAVSVVQPVDLLCDDVMCLISDEQAAPMYYDSHHLSINGALRMTSVLEDRLAQLLRFQKR